MYAKSPDTTESEKKYRFGVYYGQGELEWDVTFRSIEDGKVKLDLDITPMESIEIAEGSATQWANLSEGDRIRMRGRFVSDAIRLTAVVNGKQEEVIKFDFYGIREARPVKAEDRSLREELDQNRAAYIENTRQELWQRGLVDRLIHEDPYQGYSPKGTIVREMPTLEMLAKFFDEEEKSNHERPEQIAYQRGAIVLLGQYGETAKSVLTKVLQIAMSDKATYGYDEKQYGGAEIAEALVAIDPDGIYGRFFQGDDAVIHRVPHDEDWGPIAIEVLHLRRDEAVTHFRDATIADLVPLRWAISRLASQSRTNKRLQSTVDSLKLVLVAKLKDVRVFDSDIIALLQMVEDVGGDATGMLVSRLKNGTTDEFPPDQRARGGDDDLLVRRLIRRESITVALPILRRILLDGRLLKDEEFSSSMSIELRTQVVRGLRPTTGTLDAAYGPLVLQLRPELERVRDGRAKLTDYEQAENRISHEAGRLLEQVQRLK